MQEKPIRFGTGGWRAVIGSDFIESNIRRTAEGICALMCEEGRTDKPVIIGYDHRFLSETAARWIAEVLAAHGVPVMFLRRSAPTPLIMHTVLRQGRAGRNDRAAGAADCRRPPGGCSGYAL